MGRIGEKLKAVSVQELEVAIGEAVARLVGETPDKIVVSISRVDHDAGDGTLPGNKAKMELTLKSRTL